MAEIESSASINSLSESNTQLEQLEIELIFEGSRVDDGTAPVSYVLDALNGFARAFSKTAGRNPEARINYELRLSRIQVGSFHLILSVYEWAKANPSLVEPAVTGVVAVAAGAYKTIKDLAAVINAKKQLKGADRSSIVVNGTAIFVQNGDARFEISKDQAALIQSGAIDKDLDILTSPLSVGQVESLELKARKERLTKIEASERTYFVVREPDSMPNRQETWMIGSLNSLSKDRNRGTFYTAAGEHVSYKYSGQNQLQLFQAFAHKGVLRVHGAVSYNMEAEPVFIDIDQIELTQQDFNFPDQLIVPRRQ